MFFRSITLCLNRDYVQLEVLFLWKAAIGRVVSDAL